MIEDGLPAGAQALPPIGRAHFSYCLRTLRSVRRFQAAEVDPVLIDFVLAHAVRAGSGSNRQPWRFIVVRDQRVRASLGRWYQEGWARLEQAGYTADHATGAGHASPGQRRITASARFLAANFGDAPVVIVVCLMRSRRLPVDVFSGASIYPAVQNLLLAARAVGLGTTLTTMQALSHLDENGQPSVHPGLHRGLTRLLAIPESAVPVAVIPMGWPATQFGETDRRAPAEITYRDQWGEPWHGQ